MKESNIANILRCNPVIIPTEYRSLAESFTHRFIHQHSYAGIPLDYKIVYNRVCCAIQELLPNPAFTPKSFHAYIKPAKLFYSNRDIQLLANLYSTDPDRMFQYAMCFFAVFIRSLKNDYISVIRHLDINDVDQVLLTTLHTTLMDYNPEQNFSIQYLKQYLQDAIYALAGQDRPIPLSKNEFGMYIRLLKFIKQYQVDDSNLERFLVEINAKRSQTATEHPIFDISPKDLEKGFDITLQKAKKLLTIHYTEVNDIRAITYYEENDTFTDELGGTTDPAYIKVELQLLCEEMFPNPEERDAFWHYLNNEYSRFTKEDFDRFHITRYTLNKMIEFIRKTTQ